MSEADSATTDEGRDGVPARLDWLWSVGAFSLFINLLYLTGPIFMLQVYDRVLASANVATLVGLLGIVFLLYVFFGVLDYVRTQVVVSNAERVTDALARRAYRISVLGACDRQALPQHATALDDVSTVRGFLVSPAFTALFDLPFAPIFLLFVYALHPVLGAVATVAAMILAALAVVNERLSREKSREMAGHALAARRRAATARRNADSLLGNGMVQTLGARWQEADTASRRSGIATSTVNSGFSVGTKTLRLAVQSLILAVGAFYVIQGELTAGAMIAGSIVFGRALAPLEQILGNYTNVARARDCWANVRTWMDAPDRDADKNVLPRPEQRLAVEHLFVAPPGGDGEVVQNVDFELEAGDVLGVMGPSGSGKSTLARALVGAWPAVRGQVRLDGAEIDQWPRDALGSFVGFLPQDIELFEGDIAQNIARFSPDADMADVLEASRLAGTHEMVLNLPDGYNTAVGEGGLALSAGQRQRVALARALFGRPFLVVLDEPNANLDAEGDRALGAALTALRKRRCITVVIAHRPNVLAFVNKLMLLREGRVAQFGLRDPVLQDVRDQVEAGAATNARQVTS